MQCTARELETPCFRYHVSPGVLCTACVRLSLLRLSSVRGSKSFCAAVCPWQNRKALGPLLREQVSQVKC